MVLKQITDRKRTSKATAILTSGYHDLDIHYAQCGQDSVSSPPTRYTHPQPELTKSTSPFSIHLVDSPDSLESSLPFQHALLSHQSLPVHLQNSEDLLCTLVCFSSRRCGYCGWLIHSTCSVVALTWLLPCTGMPGVAGMPPPCPDPAHHYYQ